LYQRLLLPLDVAQLRHRGHAVDRVLLLDSYVPLIGWRQQIRYAALVHDVLPLTHPQFWPASKRTLKRTAFRSLRRARPKIFTSTEHNAAEIRRLLGMSATVVRFGCGQLADHAADAALEDPLPTREPYVVAVGTLEPRKNLVTLIDSFERVASQLPGLRLRLIGSGTAEFERLLRERISQSASRDRIEIHSHLGPGETLDLISRATALVFPSLAEGFGLPIVEALALGTPVVASDLPEIRSWAADAVAYAPTTIPAGWVEPIVAATNLSEQYRRQGQNWVRAYRWRDCAEALLDW
jgi:glycosyltransferase involved in cell wall biosynthesis